MLTTFFDELKKKKLNGHFLSDKTTAHTANNHVNVAEVW
jgi:hypothetical protein